jgi:hypothetical protein
VAEIIPLLEMPKIPEFVFRYLEEMQKEMEEASGASIFKSLPVLGSKLPFVRDFEGET